MFIIIFLTISGIFGQSVTILPTNNPLSFNLLEPEKQYSYVETNTAPASSRLQYNWSAEGADVAGVPTNSGSYTIIWNNTNDAKKIKIILTYEAPKRDKNGNIIPDQYESAQTISREEPITIKYIGNVNSIFINGNETGNGGSQVLGCSTNNVTVSSSIPDTNPSV